MISRIAHALDSIWCTAALEDGSPYRDEEDWFRDRHNMWNNYGNFDHDEKLMTMVPGWNQAQRRGCKPLGGGGGTLAYRGSGDSFEVIAPKHVNPDDPHWERIPQRCMRYSQGEGGKADPYVMHAGTFEEAANDHNLSGWNLYKTHYDPESGELHQELNDQYPNWNGRAGGARSFVDDFKDYRGGPGYFDKMKSWAAKQDKRLAGES